MQPRSLTRLLLLSPLLLAVIACAPVGQRPIGNPELPYPPQSPQIGDIVHLPTGVQVSTEAMLDIAADARIVYFGETHDNPASHRLQVEVLRGLAQRRPGRLALGMEMFSRSQQPVLDRWVAGELNEKEFLRESGWYRQWSMEFDYYRDLLHFARQAEIPVIALNAEKETVRALRQAPAEELPAGQRRQLPEMDMTDPYQRAMTLAILGDHEHGQMSGESFVRAQTLWDETMAESVASYLASPQGEDRSMLVVAGGNHVRFGFGIPRRVFRRLPTSYVLIGGREIEIPESKQDQMMDVNMPRFPMPPYDFQAYLAYEELEDPPVRLGVMIEAAGDAEGLEVTGVMPGSNAGRAGVAKGDRLLAIDGEPLAEPFDLVYAVRQKAPGDRAVLKAIRDGKPFTVEVEFREASGAHGR